jgi:hypothetical protein
VQEEEEGGERQGGREKDSHGLFYKKRCLYERCQVSARCWRGQGNRLGRGAGGIALVIEHNARVRPCQFKLQGMDLEVNADKQADREGDKEG